MECRQRGWMGAEARKERKIEGAEAGTGSWVEERRRLKVCKLAADGAMESVQGV